MLEVNLVFINRAYIRTAWASASTCQQAEHRREFRRPILVSTWGIPVVPVLLGNAQMPKECELPESLRRLKYRNAAEIRPGRDLHHHIDTLISDITGSTDAATSQPNSDGGHKTANEAYFSWKGLGLIDLIPGIRDLPYPVRFVIALIVIAMLVIAAWSQSTAQRENNHRIAAAMINDN